MKYNKLHLNNVLRSTLLFLMLCIAGLPKSYAYDFSAICETGQTLYYNIINAEYHYVELTYPNNFGNSSDWSGYERPSGNIILPESVQHEGISYSVTSIRFLAFNGCSGLTSIVIPNSVNTIGFHAFEYCSGLEQILVESGNTVYDSRDNCNAIIKTNTNELIQGCKNTNIPNSVTTIGNAAFTGCSGLTSITIPNSVTVIRDGAFEHCSGLTSIAIPNSVTTIGNFAFYYCSGLTGELLLPNSVTTIGDCAFFYCSGLTGSLTIPSSVTSIGISAFAGCNGFTGDLIIGNSVSEIGESAFGYCSFTGDLVIPNSVNSIGVHAFVGCNGFGHILVESGNTVYDSRGNCNAIIKTNTNELIQGCKNTNIPNSVTTIGNSAFGNSAFTGCSGLTSITIPNSVTRIGNYAFAGCSELTTITIPNSVTSIGSVAFGHCSGLEQILVESGNTVYDSRGNCNAIIKTNTNELIQGCKNTNIPNSVTTIGNAAFTGCSGLTSVTIPNSVTVIGDDAFYGCSGLISITIPNSVTLIGSVAFGHCSGLEQILVESGNMVYDSRGNCNAIMHTNTNELIIGCKNTVIPNSVTSIGDYAFTGCSGLTSIAIPHSVTSIGGSAFSWCSGLTGSLTIPSSVTSIGICAFYGCSGLTSITIPNSVTTIGNLAFEDCSSLSYINILAINPPTSWSSTFSGTSNTLKIYVPYESLNTYKTANNWNIYASRIYPMTYKVVPGYGEGEGNYRFIASPLVESTSPTTVDNMITETEFDLYRFNQSAELEWENWKSHENNDDHYHFNLKNGQGYLYANAEDVNLIFKGEFNEDDTKNVELVYDANAYFAGWNLVGNPFPVSAYANKSYYTMNEDGSAIDPVAVSMETAIPPCTGIMVRAEMTGQSVTFTRESRQVSNNNGILQIAVAQTNTRGTSTGSVTALDKAVVSFNEGDDLGKFVFNKDNAKLYIPQGDEEYAIAYAEKQGEKPLNFEAKESGSYTISVNPKGVEMNYLHLIDNKTGTDIDLLTTPSYTIESKTSDYASRFRLVFSAGGNTDNENEETLAFFSNGNIIVTGDYANATLQIVDMLGHVVVSTDVAHNVSTNGIASGVYVLRLINGNDVKTQKIVIR